MAWGDGLSMNIDVFVKKTSPFAFIGTVISNAWRFNKELLTSQDSRTVVVTHPCQLNLILALPALIFRNKRIVVDFYTSLYDTLVEDRGVVRKNTLFSWVLKRIDNLTLKIATVLIFDSKSNRDRFIWNKEREYGEKSVVLYPNPPEPLFVEAVASRELRDVIFVGKFSPLHGIEHILNAASKPELSKIKFTIVGSGQDTEVSTPFRNLPNIEFIDWVDYKNLPSVISAHKISLGIFGTSIKASSVFPNKVIESLRLGVPCITQHGEVSKYFENIGCVFVDAGDAEQLAECILRLLANPDSLHRLSKEALVFSKSSTFNENLNIRLAGLLVGDTSE